MKITTQWLSAKTFVSANENGNSIVMDGTPAAEGWKRGASPLEVLLMGVSGCCSVDVVGALKHHAGSRPRRNHPARVYPHPHPFPNRRQRHSAGRGAACGSRIAGKILFCLHHDGQGCADFAQRGNCCARSGIAGAAFGRAA